MYWFWNQIVFFRATDEIDDVLDIVAGVSNGWTRSACPP